MLTTPVHETGQAASKETISEVKDINRNFYHYYLQQEFFIIIEISANLAISPGRKDGTRKLHHRLYLSDVMIHYHRYI